jgi:hypothetical protein
MISSLPYIVRRNYYLQRSQRNCNTQEHTKPSQPKWYLPTPFQPRMLSLKAYQHQPYLASKASQHIIRSPPSYQHSRPTQPQSLATKVNQPTATSALTSPSTFTPILPTATPLFPQPTQPNIQLSHAVPMMQPSAHSTGATMKN